MCARPELGLFLLGFGKSALERLVDVNLDTISI